MTISVALCTYNGEKYLQAQLESLFKQTLPIDELIICDDHSNDHTHNIINEFKRIYPNSIKIVTNQINLGVKKNFEKAIQLTNKDVIFLCDQDDIWPENKVEKIINAFELNPDIMGVFTNGILIDENNNPTGLNLWESFLYSPSMQSQLDKNVLFEMILRYLPLITGASLAFKRIAINNVLPIKKNIFWHDEWIGYNLAADNLLLPLNEPLLCYRIHPDQIVGIYKDNVETIKERCQDYFLKRIVPGNEKIYIHELFIRLQKARMICNSINKKKNLLNILELEFKYEKNRSLTMMPLFKRKLILLKWILENRFETSLREFFFT